MDPALYPGMNTEIAFNGEVYQYFTPDDGRLAMAFTGGDRRPLGMTLPNPLAGAAQFMVPFNATPNDIPFPVIRNAASGFDPHVASWMQSADGESVVGVFPGGSLDLLELEHHFSYSGEGEPVVIETRVAANDAVLTRITIDEFQAVAAAGVTHILPHVVTFDGIDPSTGQPGARLEMRIQQIVVDGFAVDGDAFDIDLDQVSSICVDETREFLP